MRQQQTHADTANCIRPRIGIAVDNGSEIQNEHYSAVAQNRGAADQIGLGGLFIECFDDQFFFALNRVHQQSKFALAQRDYQYEDFFWPVVLPFFRRTAQSRYWKNPISQLQDFAVIDAMDIGFMSARDLCHCIQRDRIKALLYSKQQGFDDGQGQRQLQPEDGTLTGVADHVYRSLQTMQDALHDIQTYAAAGEFGDLVSGAESWAEDKIQNVRFVEAAGFFGFQQTSFDGTSLHFLHIDAAPVVADFHDDLIALMVGLEADRAMRRLAGAGALLVALDTVPNCIADE